MKLAACIAVYLCIAGIVSACATPLRAPEYDCSERREIELGVVEASESHAHWHTFLNSGRPGAGSGTQISYFVWPGVGGGDAPVSGNFRFGPPLDVRQRSIWLDLRVGETSLPSIPLRRTGRWQSGVSVPAAALAPLLATGGDLTITFFDRDGSLLDRTTIPSAHVIQATRITQEMYHAGQERAHNRAELCTALEEEIVLTQRRSESSGVARG